MAIMSYSLIQVNRGHSGPVWSRRRVSSTRLLAVRSHSLPRVAASIWVDTEVDALMLPSGAHPGRDEIEVLADPAHVSRDPKDGNDERDGDAETEEERDGAHLVLALPSCCANRASLRMAVRVCIDLSVTASKLPIAIPRH